jgi:hypothetical protein
VGPVRGPEGVVDVGVVALDQAGDEGGIVCPLARVEAQVFQQLDARGQLGQAGPHRFHGEPRVGLALGPAEVAAGGDLGAGTLEPFDGGQGGPDA